MKTIKVKSWGEGQGDYVLINEDDFDDEIHDKFDGEQADGEQAQKKPRTRAK